MSIAERLVCSVASDMAAVPPNYVRSVELLSRDDSRLLIVDMQEKLLTSIHDAETVAANCVKLVQGARLLGLPVSATEQYPKGLGNTVASLAELLEKPTEKQRFSCCEVLDWGTAAEPADAALRDRTKVVVCGLEAHVCVLQTVFDLLGAGYLVYVAADAVGSRRELDRTVALERLASGGAVVTTTESVLFEWCETADAAEFQQISRLVTGR